MLTEITFNILGNIFIATRNDYHGSTSPVYILLNNNSKKEYNFAAVAAITRLHFILFDFSPLFSGTWI